MRPNIGGGLALESAQLEAQTAQYNFVRDTDYGAGLWFNGGIFWTLVNHFNIGFDARLSSSNVTLFEERKNVGGFHLALLLGYRW